MKVIDLLNKIANGDIQRQLVIEMMERYIRGE